MTKPTPPPASREPLRRSNLRTVSTGSFADAGQASLDVSDAEEDGGKSDHRIPDGIRQPPVPQLCSLTVHDEAFSTEDVLFNLSSFPTDCICNGDLVQIVAVEDHLRTKHPGTAYSHSDLGTPYEASEGVQEQQRTALLLNNAKQAGQLYHHEHSLDSSKCHIFIVGKMNQEMTSKRPDLQVGHY